MKNVSRPLIAVSSDVRQIDQYSWHATPDQYIVAAAETANVTPLIIPNLGELIDYQALFAAVDGLLITGSRSNVHPTLYECEVTDAHGPFDQVRDSTTIPLIKAAIEYGIPLLAICRGMQELNVAYGGTLANDIQDIEGRSDHRSPQTDKQEERFAIRHPIQIYSGSCLEKIVNTNKIQINSVHRQAIDIPADDLAIEAIADDGTIEAVSVKSAKNFALGVQWHPEYWAKTDAPSHKILTAFGDAVRTHHQARLHG